MTSQKNIFGYAKSIALLAVIAGCQAKSKSNSDSAQPPVASAAPKDSPAVKAWGPGFFVAADIEPGSKLLPLSADTFATSINDVSEFYNNEPTGEKGVKSSGSDLAEECEKNAWSGPFWG